MNIGKLIQETRKRHGMSQRSLALRATTDQAAISRIERNESSPSIETVERLMAAMGEDLRLQATRPEAMHDPLHLPRDAPAKPSGTVSSWRSPGAGWPGA